MKRPQQRQTTLYATDRQGSLLAQLQARQLHRFAYAPFGYCPPAAGIGFNGELPDPLTGHYLLGNGYRAYNPVLMRFNSPDSLSPFGEGGVNAYVYCTGNPVNRRDPTGHFDIGDLARDVLPYMMLVSALVGSTMMYKLTKVRFNKWRAGTASKADKVMSVGAIATITSAAVVGAGGVARLVDPQSDIGYVLGVLGTVAVVGFQGVRYRGYKMGKPAPVTLTSDASLRGLPVRRSLVNRPATENSPSFHRASSIRSGLEVTRL
ncbi:RHS repeat-associated core domain-containing protein [Pseudomonas ovata]|uniref:RHS repeat-associated core domain-containing protein n=1 Tax=Pseudomonas ovata TaxID=1839709 RepID=UPI001F4DE475|nr:RHS repeat-associated core domain-containing protein [Pseudomonas ovata]